MTAIARDGSYPFSPMSLTRLCTRSSNSSCPFFSLVRRRDKSLFLPPSSSFGDLRYVGPTERRTVLLRDFLTPGVHTPQGCLMLSGPALRESPFTSSLSFSFFPFSSFLSSSSFHSSTRWMDDLLSYADQQEERKKDLSSSLPRTSLSSLHSSSSSPSHLHPSQLCRRVSRLPLDKSLRENLKTLYSITHLTPIQDQSFLPILLGEDVFVASHPGSGKTLAYLLPLLQRMINQRSTSLFSSSSSSSGAGTGESFHREASMLILLPSRELCIQVASIVLSLMPSISIVVADSHISTPFSTSSSSIDAGRRESLKSYQVSLPNAWDDQHRLSPLRNIDLIIGTPSRCVVLLRKNKISFNNLRTVVLDEGDALLRRGYISQIEELLGERGRGEEEEKKQNDIKEKKKKKIQTLIFTAVISKDLQFLLQAHFHGKMKVINLLKTPPQTRAKGQPRPSPSSTEQPVNSPGNQPSSSSPSSSPRARLDSLFCGSSVKHFTCKVPSGSRRRDVTRSLLPTSKEKKKGEMEGQQKEEEEEVMDDDHDASAFSAVEEGEMRVKLLMYFLQTKLPFHAERKKKVRRKESDSLSTSSSSSPLGMKEGARGERIDKEGDEEKEEEKKKCIIFVDTQNEVKQLAEHPYLETWRVSYLHSQLDKEKRDERLNQFRSGEVSILIATDVVARGIDIPSVTLVLHLHPPSHPLNYLHRSGRAGRGQCEGESIVLYTKKEWSRILRIKEETQIEFLNLPPPAKKQYEETAINRLLYELLQVEEEHYAPLLPRAELLLKKHGGEKVFAAMLALLYGKHRFPLLPEGSHRYSKSSGRHREDDSSLAAVRSLLTGRKGYVAVLVYDPTHTTFKSTLEVLRYLRHRLPTTASPNAVGRVCKSTKGYVADMALVYVHRLVEEEEEEEKEKNGEKRKTTWRGCAAIYPLDQLPELLLNDELKRMRRRRRRVLLPWSKMKSFLLQFKGKLFVRQKRRELLWGVCTIDENTAVLHEKER